MKKINDSKLYLYFSLITIAIGIILGLVFAYSAFIIEPEAEELLKKEDNINENFKKAYLVLRDPQIFARYEKFDDGHRPIKGIIEIFNTKIEENEEFEINDKIYLHLLLERRMFGSQLTRNTASFFAILSLLGWIFFFIEIKRQKVSQ